MPRSYPGQSPRCRKAVARLTADQTLSLVQECPLVLPPNIATRVGWLVRITVMGKRVCDATRLSAWLLACLILNVQTLPEC